MTPGTVSGRRPRVLFDAMSLGSRPSGTRTRLLELVKALTRDGGMEVGVLHGPGLDPVEHAALDGAHLLEEERPPRGPLGRLMRGSRICMRALAGFPADLLVSETLPWPRGVPLLPVVHDLRHHATGGLRSRAWRRLMEEGLVRASRVVAVSAAVARELEQAVPSCRGRVRVVPNGVDLERFRPEAVAGDEDVLARYDLPPAFMLFVGHMAPRKDPGTALEVRARLAGQGIDLPLVLVGRGPLLPEEHLYRMRGSYSDQVPGRVLRGVGTAELPALYRRARLLLAPSRLEGFGLVPLEAASCGTPVVASDIPAHREVLQDGALYAPPGDGEAFTRRVLELVYGEASPVLLGQRARERARAWSWSHAAQAFRSAAGLTPLRYDGAAP